MVDQRAGDESSATNKTIWLLAERAERTAALEYIAKQLNGRGIDARVVSLTDVIGTAAREAVAGGAERLLRSLRVVFGAEDTTDSGDAGGEEDFLGAFRRINPDVLALTSSRWVRPLSLLESVAGAPTLQIGMLTDYNLDDGWFHGSLDAFIVPAESQTERLEAHHVEPGHRYVAGPPVEQRFLEPVDHDNARSEFGFESEKRVALVRAETFAPGLLRKLVFQATLVDAPTQFLFHHNGDGAIANILRDAADEHGLPAAMFGRVSDLQDYLAASDLIVTSPADPMVAEIVGQRRPVVFVGESNSHRHQIDLLSEAYGARHLEEVVQFGSAFDRLISDDELTKMEAEASESSLAPDNESVIEALIDCAARLEELAQRGPSGGGDGPDRDEPEPEGTGGLPSKHGFEPIGRDKQDQEGDGGRGPSLSRAEARDQLAELILRERDLERQLDEAERQQQRWRDRLDLAREWNETDLAEEAESVLREHIDEAESLRERLTDIRDQKKKLKKAAGRSVSESEAAERADERAGSGADREELEERFSDMEIERELDDLRDRIKGELGEE